MIDELIKTQTFWVPIFDQDGKCILYTLVEYVDTWPVEYDRCIELFWNWEECLSWWYSKDFIEV